VRFCTSALPFAVLLSLCLDCHRAAGKDRITAESGLHHIAEIASIAETPVWESFALEYEFCRTESQGAKRRMNAPQRAMAKEDVASRGHTLENNFESEDLRCVFKFYRRTTVVFELVSTQKFLRPPDVVGDSIRLTFSASCHSTFFYGFCFCIFL